MLRAGDAAFAFRAMVETGQYSDSAARRYLEEVLIKRRDKIGQYYLTRLNPLVNFELSASGSLRFENAAVNAGVAEAPSSYIGTWFVFDNHTRATRPLGETKGAGGQLPAPAGLPSAADSFVVVELRAVEAAYPSWHEPTKVYFKRVVSGWKLVGVERMADQTPPSEPATRTITRK